MAVFSKAPPSPDAATPKNISNYLSYMQEAIDYAVLQKDKRIKELEADVADLETRMEAIEGG